MKDLVVYLARAIVDRPDAVSVEEKWQGDTSVVFQLVVAHDDLGKVIGKKGRTAKALRTLLAATAADRRVTASLEIVEPARPPAPTDGAGASEVVPSATPANEPLATVHEPSPAPLADD